jgi:AbrB family looped-hinge helix DNA binding protein
MVLPTDRKSGDKMRIYRSSLLPCGCTSLEVVGKSTITGKFQVTLPKSVREFLEADSGDFLVFVKEHDTIVVKRGRVKIED